MSEKLTCKTCEDFCKHMCMNSMCDSGGINSPRMHLKVNEDTPACGFYTRKKEKSSK